MTGSGSRPATLWSVNPLFPFVFTIQHAHCSVGDPKAASAANQEGDKGGFYRHFKSKDELFVEAVARAFEETGSGMVEVAKSAPEGQALRAIIECYLSAGHANSLGTGCALSALGPELARKPLSVRKRIEALLEAYRERLLPFIPGQTREEKLAKCRLLFPSMAGVLMMARVTSGPQRREQMLMEARTFFIKSFAE